MLLIEADQQSVQALARTHGYGAEVGPTDRRGWTWVCPDDEDDDLTWFVQERWRALVLGRPDDPRAPAAQAWNGCGRRGPSLARPAQAPLEARRSTARELAAMFGRSEVGDELMSWSEYAHEDTFDAAESLSHVLALPWYGDTAEDDETALVVRCSPTHAQRLAEAVAPCWLAPSVDDWWIVHCSDDSAGAFWLTGHARLTDDDMAIEVSTTTTTVELSAYRPGTWTRATLRSPWVRSTPDPSPAEGLAHVLGRPDDDAWARRILDRDEHLDDPAAALLPLYGVPRRVVAELRGTPGTAATYVRRPPEPADRKFEGLALAAMLLVALVAGALVVRVTSRPFAAGDTASDHLWDLLPLSLLVTVACAGTARALIAARRLVTGHAPPYRA